MRETDQTALGMQVPRLSSSIIGWLWLPWTAPDVVQDNACVALDVLSVREELGRQVAEAEAEASARTHTDLEGIPRVPDDLV